MQFELAERDGKIVFYLMYYPNDYPRPVDEVYGTWDTNQNKMENIKNDNPYPVAIYSFTNISYYNESDIEITIHTEKVLNKQYEKNVIPDGTYDFRKE